MTSSQLLPWLPVSDHGFQPATTMASSQPLPCLPVSCCHGFQSATTMASSQPLLCLPVSCCDSFWSATTVSCYHGFQAASTMASSLLLCFLLGCLSSCSPQKQHCQQLHHLLPLGSNLFQVLRLSCICAGLACRSSSAMAQPQEHHIQ